MLIMASSSSSAAGPSRFLCPSQPRPSEPSITNTTAIASTPSPSTSSTSISLSSFPKPSTTSTTPSRSSSSSNNLPFSNSTRSSRASTTSTLLPQQPNSTSINQAKQAVTATLGNLLDRELSHRAELLHANNNAILKQEKDVKRGIEVLKRENDKLEKVVRETGKKVKEIGNVQNWAEMLEREFMILEETLRIVDRGEEDSEEGSWSGSGSDWDEGEEEEVRAEDVPLPDSRASSVEREDLDHHRILE
ncbi:hypothetical protein QBC38DRAFT_473785 [Podospora fimiseda]|uniref:Biogenesis of lysosome-related organelles complex 1 subunit 1 n=1 Tax=Podospora fimiseda TaxID=252190 RepID=A0AAN7BSM6_9PEZI|nr:hypothetical protein QBC38DRAFT_473785 [Podospora fimiseda]